MIGLLCGPVSGLLCSPLIYSPLNPDKQTDPPFAVGRAAGPGVSPESEPGVSPESARSQKRI